MHTSTKQNEINKLPSKRAHKMPAKYKDYEITPVGHSTQSLPTQTNAKKKVINHAISDLVEHSLFTKRTKNSIIKRTKAHKSNRLHPVINREKKTINDLGITNMPSKNYIASAIDKPELFTVKPLHILKSTGGFGLYAEEDIPANTCIGMYTGKEYTKQAFKDYLAHNKEADSSYAMEIGSRIVDARLAGNFTRYINFSDCQSNVEFKESLLKNKKVVILTTTKTVLQGEQLLVDYNIYNEQASKDYYFLNPQDNNDSTAQFYDKNSKSYEMITCPIDLEFFNAKKGSYLYLTKIGKCLVENKLLNQSFNSLDNTVNYPYLKLNDNKAILDAIEVDLFTPLMIACYLGQHNNADWLIKHGANIDQQQNHDGNCPLFIALEGYRQSNDKKNYLEIIKLLILNKANVRVHDRQDKIFLHKAVSILTPQDLTEIINLLSTTMKLNFGQLYTYIDQNEHDIVTYCLANNQVDKAIVLLRAFPDYFKNNFIAGTKYLLDYNKTQFKSAVQSLSVEEQDCFLKKLNQLGFKISKSLKTELNLMSKSSSFVI